MDRSRQFSEPSEQVPWRDHPQTDRLYNAEHAWMNITPAAHQQLSSGDAEGLLRQISGRRSTRIIENPVLGVTDLTGKRTERIPYMVSGGHLMVNPNEVGPKYHVGMLTHEGAHLLGETGHGPNLASRHLDVVNRVMGPSEYKSLRDIYDHFKVSYAGRK